MIWLHLCEVLSTVVKFVETDSRIAVARGVWGQGDCEVSVFQYEDPSVDEGW